MDTIAEIGNVFVSVIPSMKGFAQKVNTELRGIGDVSVNINLNVDAQAAQAKIDAAAQNRTAKVNVDADTAAADAKLAGTDAEASRLDGRRLNLSVVADVGNALANLASVVIAANSIDGRSLGMNVNVDIGAAMAKFATLNAAALAIGAGAGAAAGGILSVGAAGAVAATAIGPLGLAFSGVGKALSAMSAQEQSAGQSAQQSAKQHQSAANSIANAQAGLANAVRSAAATRRQAAASVANAEASLADATARATQTRRQAAESVQNAELQAARSVASALRAQEAAQRTLQRASADLAREQSKLSLAWEEGKRALQDLQDQVDMNALDQRQAAFDLADAQRALEQVRGTGDVNAIARAQLAYDKQVETIDELNKKTQRLGEDNTKAQAAGVAGSSQVISANEAIANAQQRVQDATIAAGQADQAVNQARADGARSVAQAHEQAAAQIASADQGVLKAQQALAQARQSAADQDANASASVANAQRALAQAYQQSGDAGSAAANKVASAMAGLSQPARDFVNYIHSLKPAFAELSGIAAAGIFPGMTAGIRSLMSQLGTFKGVIRDIAAGTGDAFRIIGAELSNPAWMSFFQQLGASARTVIPMVTHAFMDVAAAGRDIIQALLPVAPIGAQIFGTLGKLLGQLAGPLGQVAAILGPALLQALQALQPAFGALGDILVSLAPVLGDITRVVANVLSAALVALAPVVRNLAPLFQTWANALGGFLIRAIQNLAPYLDRMSQWLAEHPRLVGGAVLAIGGLVGGFNLLMRGVGLLIGPLTLVTLGARLFGVSVSALLSPVFSAAGAIGGFITKLGSGLNFLTLGRTLLTAVGDAMAYLMRSVIGAIGPLGWIAIALGTLFATNQQFRDSIMALLGAFGQLIGAVVTSLMPIFTALGDLTNQVGGAFGVVANAAATVLVPVVQALTSVLQTLTPILVPLIDAFLVWKTAMFLWSSVLPTAISGVTTLGSAMASKLAPSAVTAALNTTKFGSAAMNAGGLTAGMTGALTRAAGWLPVVGLAAIGVVAGLDALGTSTNEAADALLKGGSAAAGMRAELAANDAEQATAVARWGQTGGAIREWIGSMIGAGTTTRQANDALRERIATMGPLEAAQARQTLAQNDYNDAVVRFGSASPQAALALAGLRDRTNDVNIAQRAARDGTDLATAAIANQRDTIQGTVDADLQKRQAVNEMKQAQQGLADAIAQYGRNSPQAESASLQLEQAQSRVSSSALHARDGLNGQARAIGDMVAQSQGQLTPTLNSLVQGLDQSGLSAAGARVQFDAAGHAVAIFPNGKTVTLDANTSPVYPALAAVKLAVDSTHGTIGVDADTGPGVMNVGAFKLATDATRGVVTVDGNITPADQQRLGIQAKTDGTTGTMWINGNPLPCDGRLNGMRAHVDATTGVMTIDGNPAPADRASAGAHDLAGRPASFDLNANTAPARGGILGFFDWLNGVAHSFNVMVGLEGRSMGGLVGGFARGGMVRRFAPGGMTGPIRGPGTATSDSIPAMLSNGEFVIRASAVDAIGLPVLMALNKFSRGGPVGFAAGGAVMGASVGLATGGAVPTAPTMDPAIQQQLAAATAAASDALTAQQGATEALNAQQAALAATITATTPQIDAMTLATTTDTLASQVFGQQVVTMQNTALVPLTGFLQGPMAASLDQLAFQTQVQQVNAIQDLMSWHPPLRNTMNDTGNFAVATWDRINRFTGDSVAYQIARFNDLMGGLARVRQAMGETAAWTGQQYAYIAQVTATNMRYVLQGPFNAGIIAAWNSLNGQFALGKPVPPVGIGFATGGEVRGPGTATSDSINARLSDGEFVVRADVAQRHLPFLAALNSGRGANVPGFATGGVFGGGPMDPKKITDDAFLQTYAMIAGITNQFGGTGGAITQGVTRTGADGVKKYAFDKITAMLAAALGPLGSGAPFYVAEISRAAKAHGGGPDMARIGVATAIVESALRMYANTAVPASLAFPHDAVGHDHDSVGLFQQRQAGWGTIAQRMNAFGSAMMFFDRLVRFNWRGMDPGAAAQRVQSSAFPGRYSGQMGRAAALVAQFGGYATGGVVPGTTGVDSVPGMLTPGERVLTPTQNATFEAMVAAMYRRGDSFDTAGLGGNTPTLVQNIYPRENQSETSIGIAAARHAGFVGRLPV